MPKVQFGSILEAHPPDSEVRIADIVEIRERLMSKIKFLWRKFSGPDNEMNHNVKRRKSHGTINTLAK